MEQQLVRYRGMAHSFSAVACDQSLGDALAETIVALQGVMWKQVLSFVHTTCLTHTNYRYFYDSCLAYTIYVST